MQQSLCFLKMRIQWLLWQWTVSHQLVNQNQISAQIRSQDRPHVIKRAAPASGNMLQQPANLQKYQNVFPLLVSSTGPSTPPSSTCAKPWKHLRNNVSSLFPPKAVKTATCRCFRQIRQFFTDMVCYISINPIFILPLTTTSPRESLIRLPIWLVYLEQSRVPFWLQSAQCTEVGFFNYVFIL